jgi:hypothetical protein
MMPLAPGFGSTLNVCFIDSPSLAASSRATTSLVPPAPKGTTTRTGLDGYGSAADANGAAATQTMSASARRRRSMNMMLPPGRRVGRCAVFIRA